MDIHRRLLQHHRYHLIVVFAIFLMGSLDATSTEGQTMLIPETSQNARVAKQLLGLDSLRPRETPLVPLRIDDASLTAALPDLTVSRNTSTIVDGWDTLELRFTDEGVPVGSVSIVRVVPIEDMSRTVSTSFALFSGPVDDLVAHRDSTLDLLATFDSTDTYAWAVRGSFFTTARGPDAKHIAKVVTDLLFMHD